MGSIVRVNAMKHTLVDTVVVTIFGRNPLHRDAINGMNFTCEVRQVGSHLLSAQDPLRNDGILGGPDRHRGSIAKGGNRRPGKDPGEREG
jgi:hypothetical protein